MHAEKVCTARVFCFFEWLEWGEMCVYTMYTFDCYRINWGPTLAISFLVRYLAFFLLNFTHICFKNSRCCRAHTHTLNAVKQARFYNISYQCNTLCGTAACVCLPISICSSSFRWASTFCSYAVLYICEYLIWQIEKVTADLGLNANMCVTCRLLHCFDVCAGVMQ